MHSPTKTHHPCSISVRRLLPWFVCVLFASRRTPAAVAIVELNSQQFKTKIDEGSFRAIIDVRRQDEWDAGHIENATFMQNLASFGSSSGQVSTPDDLAGCEYCSIAAYCRSGARARAALTILRDNGFKGDLYNGQGVSQWETAGYALVKTDSVTPPCTVDVEVSACQETQGNGTVDDPSSGGGFCFSGRSVVDVQDKGPVAMESLQVGDWVRVRDGRFAPVYSFGHFQPNANAHYLQILSKEMDGNSPLEISAEHLIYVQQQQDHHGASTEAKRLIPAGSIKVGDFLWTANGAMSLVVSIRTVQRVGAFSPLTTTGDLVVNGVLVSNYVSRGWVMESERVSGEALHWLQHGAATPYRMFCYVSGGCRGERYDRSTGFSAWVQFWYGIEQWQLRQRHRIRTILLSLFFPPTICFICLGILVESPMSEAAFHLVVALVGLWIWKHADKLRRKATGKRK